MPRPARTEARVRLHLELPERVRERLEELREMTEADTVTEVVRRALSFYDALVTAKNEDGVTVVVRGKDGRERELLLP